MIKMVLMLSLRYELRSVFARVGEGAIISKLATFPIFQSSGPRRGGGGHQISNFPK